MAIKEMYDSILDKIIVSRLGSPKLFFSVERDIPKSIERDVCRIVNERNTQQNLATITGQNTIFSIWIAKLNTDDSENWISIYKSYYPLRKNACIVLCISCAIGYASLSTCLPTHSHIISHKVQNGTVAIFGILIGSIISKMLSVIHHKYRDYHNNIEKCLMLKMQQIINMG